MVQLTEVEDVPIQNRKIEDDDDFIDTESEISADSDYDPAEETLAERLAALQDMVPATTRAWVWGTCTAVGNIVWGTGSLAGRVAWTLSVSALLVGVPYALATAEDQNLMAMEQEQKMREMGGEMLTAGADGRDRDVMTMRSRPAL